MRPFLIDTNAIVYAAGVGVVADRCRALLLAVADGRLDGRASTAVLEEVWHLELSGRVPGMDGHTALAVEVLSPLLAITDEVFGTALALDAPGLGANDRLHAATCFTNEIAVIVSSDRGFDAVAGLERVDPMEQEPIAALADE